MGNRHFISQNSLAPLPKVDLEGRVIVADFAVFHDRPNNSAHFVEVDTEGGHNEDYLAGLEAGKVEASAVYENTIKLMEDTLGQLKEMLATKVEAIEQSHGRAVLKSLEVVLPALAERSLLIEMKSVIEKTTFSETCGEIIARLHPNNKTAKSFLLSNRAVCDGGTGLSIDETEEMSETAVAFSWGVTRVEIDPESNAKQCLRLLSQAFEHDPKRIQSIDIEETLS